MAEISDGQDLIILYNFLGGATRNLRCGYVAILQRKFQNTVKLKGPQGMPASLIF